MSAQPDMGRTVPQQGSEDTRTQAVDTTRAVRLSPRVWRVTADNGSVMTGPGTNTYLVGDPSDNTWAVIDPGPLDARHLRAVMQAAPGRVTQVLVTHTHIDHSPGAAVLQAEHGLPVLGLHARHPERQDASFAPDRLLSDGERFPLGARTTLRAIHTPGHASNHVCYLLEEERTLFTGDHIMQGSTVIVNPPDGDMSAYLRSLEFLKSLDLAWLAPGHGTMMADPQGAIERLVRHRLMREAKVVGALERQGRGTLDMLVPTVYDDVPASRHGIAQRSLEAHLLKLREDGRALEEGGVWQLAGRLRTTA